MSNPGYLISRVTTPAQDTGLITLDQAKAILGIPTGDTSQDETIKAMIASVSDGICTYCDRQFVVQGYRDQYRNVSLSWGMPLRCWQHPVVVDTDTKLPKLTVTVEGTVLDPASYDVNIETGEIYLLNSVWASPGPIILDYVAGYDPIPSDLMAGANQWLFTKYNTKDQLPGTATRSESISDAVTVTYGDSSGSSSSSSQADYVGPPSYVCDAAVGYRRQSV